jgi:glyoxylase-like metal-dependent hydrolase (beta-lactamase superfamily II)
MRRGTTVALLLVGLAGCQPAPDGQAGSETQAEDGRATRELFALGSELDEAVEIAPGVFQARGTGNAHAVVTEDGVVVIDTGLSNQPRVQEQLRRAAPGKVSHIILTHAHADHYSATDAFADEDTEVVAHAEFEHNQRYLKELSPLLMSRNAIFFPDNTPAIPGVLSGLVRYLYPTVEPTRTIVEPWAFEQGGVRFEVLPLPGAEGSDGLAVWLPESRILFVGDFFGASFPMWPNLTSMRGERARFPKPYIDSLDRVLELDPLMLVPSHFEPIDDPGEIRGGVRRTRDAVAFVEQAVFEGMNDGKDVYTLMEEIRLPPELALPEPHGKVSWGVRSIWEAYTGWFHLRETSELYALPRDPVYAEVVEMAGGPGALAERARRRLDEGQSLEALHLTEIALAAAPGDEEVRLVHGQVLERLLEESGRSNHFETFWLEHRIARNRDGD